MMLLLPIAPYMEDTLAKEGMRQTHRQEQKGVEREPCPHCLRC